MRLRGVQPCPLTLQLIRPDTLNPTLGYRRRASTRCYTEDFVLDLYWRDGDYRRQRWVKRRKMPAPMSAQSLTERNPPNSNAPCGSEPARDGVVSADINGSAGLIASTLDF